MSTTVRIDDQTRLASVLDVIRLRNGIRSNHAAALLALISAKHKDLQITRARVNSKGRETPLADAATVERILQLCPVVRATTRKATQDSVLIKVQQATGKVLRRKPLVRKLQRSNGQAFGNLHSLLKKHKIHKIC